MIANRFEKGGLRHPDCGSGFFFFALSCTVCYVSWQLGLGKSSQPGPGFMPFLAGLLLGILSLTFLIQTLSREGPGPWEIQVRWGNFLSVTLAMIAYAYLLERVGFVFVTFFFVALLMRFIGPQNWGRAIVGGTISSVAAYLLFETFLKSQLPRSFLRIF